MPDARYEAIDAAHFDFYPGESFERSVTIEIEFLRAALGLQVAAPRAPPSRSATRTSPARCSGGGLADRGGDRGALPPLRLALYSGPRRCHSLATCVPQQQPWPR
jgi:hypothetical protein